MVGSTRKGDVKSRLGNRGIGEGKARPGKIRDARDVLRKKVPRKGRVNKTTNLEVEGRIKRLFPLGNLPKKKVVYSSDKSSKSNIRTLSLTRDSLRITTKQPELCRQSIVSKNSLKVVTPSKAISSKEETPPPPPVLTTTRTLTNDLYTRPRPPLTSHMDEDLRMSTPILSFTRADRPLLRNSLSSRLQDNTGNKNLTKIVVTNLHPRVVQDDITELFGAVGPLTNVKLDNCVAEVVFTTANHANQAYQKYHNRMLDGQAMKCTLGLPNAPLETSRGRESLNYHGSELVYPQTTSRSVVFHVQI